jgi:hypothetical protein
VCAEHLLASGRSRGLAKNIQHRPGGLPDDGQRVFHHPAGASRAGAAVHDFRRNVCDADHLYWASARRIQRQRSIVRPTPGDIAAPTIDIVQLALTDDYVVWRNEDGTIFPVPARPALSSTAQTSVRTARTVCTSGARDPLLSAESGSCPTALCLRQRRPGGHMGGTSRRVVALLSLFSMLAGPGCAGTAGEGTDPGAPTNGVPVGAFGPGQAGAAPADATECTKMDIVFVVDNSRSMGEEQKNLVASFPKFIGVVDKFRTKAGVAFDYRVAVTTTDDVQDQGRFTRARGAAAPATCTPGPDRPWLERSDGDVAGLFACRAQSGTRGARNERPLESLLLGITARIADGQNANANGEPFVRQDALLAFVAITDEDEGSRGTSGSLARAMSEYPPAIDAVKGGRGQWAASVIAGPTACSSPGLGSAKEAVRLKQFVADVGKNGVFTSICAGDLTVGLTEALATFHQACKAFPASLR